MKGLSEGLYGTLPVLANATADMARCVTGSRREWERGRRVVGGERFWWRGGRARGRDRGPGREKEGKRNGEEGGGGREMVSKGNE